VDINLEVAENPQAVAEILKSLAAFMVAHQFKHPSPLEVFSVDRIAEAMKSVREPGHIGEAILTLDTSDQIPVSPSARKPLSLRKDATYVISGGLGGLGRSLARLLVAHGAGNLVFISRSGMKSANAQSLVDEITGLGATVRVYACDISNEQGMSEVFNACSKELPPIQGVIQSAAVLNDAIYENMTYELWQEAIKPKIQGSWLLHKLLPRDMDFFVMLSSIAGVVGNRSQTSYATGNTYQDALAKFRREQGLPAVAIDLGLMAGIGLIAERGGFTNLRKSEAVALNERDFHEIVKAAMVGSYGETAMPAQLVTGLPSGGILHRQDLDPPFYFDDPRFSFLKKMGLEQAIKETGGGEGATEGGVSLATQLSQSTTLSEATQHVTNAICAQLAKGLQTSPENIDVNKPLHSYGVDSLMAVEIRSWILQQLKADVTMFDVLSGTSISALAGKVTAASKLVPAGLE
jgi:zearalenone synthase (highly reducing iterative type I polyketide synthase)